MRYVPQSLQIEEKREKPTLKIHHQCLTSRASSIESQRFVDDSVDSVQIDPVR